TGQRVVTGSQDRTVRVWNADGAGEPVVLRGDSEIKWAAFTPDGRIVAVDRSLWLPAADGTGRKVVFGENLVDRSSVYVAAVSPDGRRIATGEASGAVRLWNVDNFSEPTTFRGHRHSVHRIAFSSDGQRVVTAS